MIIMVITLVIITLICNLYFLLLQGFGFPQDETAYGTMPAPGLWFQGGMMPGAPPMSPFAAWGPGAAGVDQTQGQWQWGGRDMCKMWKMWWRRHMKQMYGKGHRKHGGKGRCCGGGRKRRGARGETPEKMDAEGSAEKNAGEEKQNEAGEGKQEDVESSSSSSSSSESEGEGAEGEACSKEKEAG